MNNVVYVCLCNHHHNKTWDHSWTISIPTGFKCVAIKSSKDNKYEVKKNWRESARRTARVRKQNYATFIQFLFRFLSFFCSYNRSWLLLRDVFQMLHVFENAFIRIKMEMDESLSIPFSRAFHVKLNFFFHCYRDLLSTIACTTARIACFVTTITSNLL